MLQLKFTNKKRLNKPSYPIFPPCGFGSPWNTKPASALRISVLSIQMCCPCLKFVWYTTGLRALNWGNCHQAVLTEWLTDRLPGWMTGQPAKWRPSSRSGIRCTLWLWNYHHSIRKRAYMYGDGGRAHYQIVHFSLSSGHNCIRAACKCSILASNANCYCYIRETRIGITQQSKKKNRSFKQTWLIIAAVYISQVQEWRGSISAAGMYVLSHCATSLIKIDISSHKR